MFLALAAFLILVFSLFHSTRSNSTFHRTYVAGRSVASIPFAMFDAVLYGTIVYFFVGLAHKDGASVVSYFVFVAIMFTVSLTSGLFFSVFSACVQDVTTAQAAMAIIAVVFVLFSGFTVQVRAILLCMSGVVVYSCSLRTSTTTRCCLFCPYS